MTTRDARLDRAPRSPRPPVGTAFAWACSDERWTAYLAREAEMVERNWQEGRRLHGRAFMPGDMLHSRSTLLGLMAK